MPTFKMELTRTFGGQTFTVTSHVSFDEKDSADRKLAETDKAFDGLTFLMDRYAAKIAPTQNPPAGGRGAAHSSGSGGINVAGGVHEQYTENGVRLFRELKGGKESIKMTTPGLRYGVVIQPYLLKQAGIDPDSITPEGIKAHHLKLTYDRTPTGRIARRLEVEF